MRDATMRNPSTAAFVLLVVVLFVGPSAADDGAVVPNFLDILNPFRTFFNPILNPPSSSSSSSSPYAAPPTPRRSRSSAAGGMWELVKNDSGVSAMHLVITKNNKAILFDATIFQPAQLRFPPPCRTDPKTKKPDCWAHSVELDLQTFNVRTLKVTTDTWCSSGGFAPDGTLVQAGGWDDGGNVTRYLSPCDTCDWKEFPNSLSTQRWYATQQILSDGSFILVGGRRAFSYEYIPPPGKSNAGASFPLPFLRQTTDVMENNLYPFVVLIPDGTLFVFANNRSVVLDPRSHRVLRELPPLPGGSRNYPASAAASLLPIDLSSPTVAYEILICGGAPSDSAAQASKLKDPVLIPALQSCGRIDISAAAATWQLEDMPTPRVMGDMILLPDGGVLVVNGGKVGTSGWGWGGDPNLEPVLYTPTAPSGGRFRRLAPSAIPRMYHSTSALLPDAAVMIAGSNPNTRYVFAASQSSPFPTEFRVEKFYPPYLAAGGARPAVAMAPATARYGQRFVIEFTMDGGSPAAAAPAVVRVSMYSPPFTTHATSMGQRMIMLKGESPAATATAVAGRYSVGVVAPSAPEVAPPGYYMVFVVAGRVPSHAVWIQMVR